MASWRLRSGEKPCLAKSGASHVAQEVVKKGGTETKHWEGGFHSPPRQGTMSAEIPVKNSRELPALLVYSSSKALSLEEGMLVI
jgi:hypothetical protein